MLRALSTVSSLAVLCVIAATVRAQPRGPAPVAYLTFDEGVGTTAADSSGNGHPATLFGTSGWTAGLVGRSALGVPGRSDGYAEIPTPVVDTTHSFSVAAWVKVNRVGGYQTFVSEDGPVLSSFFLQLRGDTNWFSFTSRTTSSCWRSPDSLPSPGAGITSPASLYVDGVLQDTVYSVVAGPATGPTGIGRGKFAGNRVDFVNGAVDDVRLYQTALTAAEVIALDTSQPIANTALDTSLVRVSGRIT